MDIFQEMSNLQKKYVEEAKQIAPGDEQKQLTLFRSLLNAYADGRALTTKLYDGGFNDPDSICN